MNAAPRQRLRLLLRDLAAGSAFGAMAISGELPTWSLLLFALGLALALFDLRLLSRVSVVTGVGVAASAALLYARVALGSLDLVVAACAFASLITLHRLLSAPTPRTDHQVLLTSLLMLSGGAALSGELLYALMLGLFAAFACCSLALGVIERTLPERSSFSVRPLVPWMVSGLLAAVVGAVLCFVLLPRVSWNAMARRTSKGLGPTTGLSDGIELGRGTGSIKTNPRIVARIELRPDPGTPALDAHWVAATYGTWDGHGWSDHRPKQRPRVQVQLRGGSLRPITQKIELLPAYGSTLAFALVEPLLLGNATAHEGNSHVRTRLVEAEGQEIRFLDRAESYTYFAYSVAPDTELPPPARDDAELARLTTLPQSLDPRIAGLTAQILGDERDPLRAAEKLTAYLKANYRYTLELPDSPDDPLADFLFQRKAGHCEYFATALAVMLRTQGFATRVATGFYGGERVGDLYVLRAGDAHAWTQVWDPHRGFVNVDATPDAGRAAQPIALLSWWVRAYERLDELWRGSVLDFTLRDQVGMAFHLKRLRLPSRSSFIYPGLALLGIYAVWRLRLLRRRRPRRHPATRLREEAETLLAAAQIRVEPGEGLQELSARLNRSGHPCAGALDRLTRRYLGARFGDAPLRPGEAEALLTRLRAELRAADVRRAA